MSNTRKPRNHAPRRSQISPHSGEGRQLGLDDRDIPSGMIHLVNAETKSARPAKPEAATFPVQNTHGVDPGELHADRPEQGVVLIDRATQLEIPDYAVPVYQVELPGRGKVRRDVTAEVVPVAGNAANPTRICSIDPQRVQVSLLNEDAANDVRFSESESTVIEGRGAKLPHGMINYRSLGTQGELWAISTAAAPVYVSVILETEIAAGSDG